jgi:hypothetical protein
MAKRKTLAEGKPIEPSVRISNAARGMLAMLSEGWRARASSMVFPGMSEGVKGEVLSLRRCADDLDSLLSKSPKRKATNA